jgi:hypothetical protein
MATSHLKMQVQLTSKMLFMQNVSQAMENVSNIILMQVPVNI